jgi:hypothetical protein
LLEANHLVVNILGSRALAALHVAETRAPLVAAIALAVVADPVAVATPVAAAYTTAGDPITAGVQATIALRIFPAIDARTRIRANVLASEHSGGASGRSTRPSPVTAVIGRTAYAGYGLGWPNSNGERRQRRPCPDNTT